MRRWSIPTSATGKRWLRCTRIECPSFGPIEDLRLIECESPALRPGTIRIAVSACGVNFVDGVIVEGRYQIKPPVPFVPGMEVVGRVTELASDVSSLDGAPLLVGDRVFANLGFGGYASEAVAPLSQVSRVATSLTDGQAATFMQSYMTGWFALCVRAQVRAGQSLLVLGAGSGVGLAAVDIVGSRVARDRRGVLGRQTGARRAAGRGGDDRHVGARCGGREGCGQGVRGVVRWRSRRRWRRPSL